MFVSILDYKKVQTRQIQAVQKLKRGKLPNCWKLGERGKLYSRVGKKEPVIFYCAGSEASVSFVEIAMNQ
jgi:hypothetical protein